MTLTSIGSESSAGARMVQIAYALPVAEVRDTGSLINVPDAKMLNIQAPRPKIPHQDAQGRGGADVVIP